jgi:tetratricopeptide (TPR) repeat protein
MPAGHEERYDFFLSRRGSVAAVAREVADVLTGKGYKVLVQDYDIPLGASFVEAMHEAVKNSRDLVILFTRDYEQSPYTRKEFTSFEAERAQSTEERHVIVLRCEDVPLRGLLADSVYQDLVDIEDPEERKRRIIAAAERQSQAARPPPRPFIGVPPRIATFTGRADELDLIDAILMHDKPAAVTQASVGRAAVQGLGGVGKTSLATEYAHRYRQLYAGVCWCPAETRTGLLSSLASLDVIFGAATTEEADVEKAAKAALRRLAEQRATWLLIYDSVSSPDQIADLLPAAGARVLITSRFSDWSELAVEVPLDVLPLEEAIALLQSRTAHSDAAGAKTLAEALGRLPLALDHAAAYCKRTQMRLANYATKASRLMDAAPRGVGYPRSVAATFNLAIAEAVAQCAAAEPLMAYLAQCAPERIPMILVEGAVEDEAQRMEALAALADVSLVKPDPFEDGTPAVTVHRLVQVVARARSEANCSTWEVVGRVIARMEAIYPNRIDAGSWSLCAQLAPHLTALHETVPSWPRILALHAPSIIESWSKLLHRGGAYLYERAAHAQAASFVREELAINEATLGPEDRSTASTLNNLACVLMQQDDLAGARPLFERAQGILEKTLGPEHPDTAAYLANLANVVKDQGDLAGSRPLFERALAIHEKACGPEHPDTARSLQYLANLNEEQGDLAGAQALTERAIAILEKVVGRESPDTAASLHNLAHIFEVQGKLAEARALGERAVAIYEKVLGGEHPHTALSLHTLAHILETEGQLARARELYERVLAISEKMVGPEHPDTATNLSSLAFLLQQQGDLVGALPLHERALAIREKVHGSGHPSTNRLAATCRISSSAQVTRQKRCHWVRQPSPPRKRLSEKTINGPRTAPASPPTPSTCSAAATKPQRCGSGMGSQARSSQTLVLNGKTDCL